MKELLEQVKIFNATLSFNWFWNTKIDKPKFNNVHSRNNLSKIKDGAYIINLDEYKSIGTHWTTLYVNDGNVTYFDNFGVKYILGKIKQFINNQNFTENIFRIQAYNSIMCRYFCTGFFNLVLKGNSLLFSSNEYEKNDKIILTYSQLILKRLR